MIKFYHIKFYSVFEGEGEGEQTGTTQTGTTQTTAQTGTNGNTVVTTTFTQEDVNKFLAEDRRKHKAQTEKTIAELEQLKKSKSLSDQERVTLANRIEELSNQILTKEQLLEKEKAKLQNEHKTQLQKESEEKEGWKKRYTESTITRSIVDAASSNDAFSAEQVVALLQPHTKLVEDVDSDGNALGTFTPRVKFSDVDKDGKPIILDLSVPEAVKRMKDTPEKYGNLFKANIASGIGGSQSVGTTRPLDVNRIKTPEQYLLVRKRLTGRGKS